MMKQQYPTPEERAQIIARRERLSRELIEYRVTRSDDMQEAREQLNPIVREYGFDEVYRMLKHLRERLDGPDDPAEEQRRLYA